MGGLRFGRRLDVRTQAAVTTMVVTAALTLTAPLRAAVATMVVKAALALTAPLRKRPVTMVRTNPARISATRCAAGLVVMSRRTSVGALHATLSASAAMVLHIPMLVVYARTKAAPQLWDASQFRGKVSFCW